jgi:hypothetical protein
MRIGAPTRRAHTSQRLDGGTMLTRGARDAFGTASTLRAGAAAVTELAAAPVREVGR